MSCFFFVLLLIIGSWVVSCFSLGLGVAVSLQHKCCKTATAGFESALLVEGYLGMELNVSPSHAHHGGLSLQDCTPFHQLDWLAAGTKDRCVPLDFYVLGIGGLGCRKMNQFTL